MNGDNKNRKPRMWKKTLIRKKMTELTGKDEKIEDWCKR